MDIRRRKKIRKLAAALLRLALCALLVLPLLAPGLTPRAATVVRVGYDLRKDYQEGAPGEIKSGYGYEYLQTVRNYTGWEFEYVYGEREELLDMLERGEIDLMSHVARTPARANTMLFSLEPQGTSEHYLYTCETGRGARISRPYHLQGKKVGAVAGDFRTPLLEDWLKAQGVTCEIVEYPDTLTLHEALHDGTLDAASEGRIVSSQYPGDWKAAIRLEDIPLYFAVNRERQDLLERLDHAQSRILELDPFYGQELRQQYREGEEEQILPLDGEELALLAARENTLQLGYCVDHRPLADRDAQTGQLYGLVDDYLKAMTQTYGIQFETRAYQSGVELLEGLNNGEVDVISPVSYYFGMAEISGISTTDAMAEETMLAVYKDYRDGGGDRSIFRRVAVLAESVAEKDYAKRFYPNAELVQAKTIGEAIKLVDNGRADCYMIRSSTWACYKEDYPLLNRLKILSLPDSFVVNMAVRTSDVELIPILNKGIALLDQSDVNQAIMAYSSGGSRATWLSLMLEHPITTAIGVLAFVLLMVLIGVIYRLRTESRYLKQLQTAKEEADRARAEADRANQAKSTFLTSMSHDIRTPMNAIIGMTTLASKRLNDPDYIRKCLGKVTLASDHLLTLVNDVLDINKIESGNLSLSPTVFSLADSVMNLANIGRHQLNEKQHRFDIRVHNVKEEYLFADELRINQIFINLLSNAVKYTPAGGRITVDVKQEPLPGETGRVRLIYIVADNGIGMSEEFQQHMYELFTMANRNSRTVNGSGVGLAICKQLVDLMEGTIQCESRLGEGTCFTVTLDLPVAERVVDHLILPPMALLLVDDDEDFLASAADTLRDLGLSPDCVSSGEEAVRVVEDKHRQSKDYPVIIVDWKMPGMDGLATTRAIRALVGPEVSIIVVSAYAPEEVRDAALAAGANGFISKPFFRTSVCQTMSEILGLHTGSEEEGPDSHRKVRGMHLLVAEDNDLNWEIAHELLQLYGVTARRAENGRQCVDMLEQAPPRTYDAVLMDIQMPELNGYEAALAIRGSEQEHLRRIPIVAMTADAYTEDVLRCAEAGMNAHIPKPIDMEKLLEVLGELR